MQVVMPHGGHSGHSGYHGGRNGRYNNNNNNNGGGGDHQMHGGYGNHGGYHRNKVGNMGMGNQNMATIRCCDPYNQKIYDVPAYMVEETQGKHTYTSNPTGRRAQVCMRYQDGQCNMKLKCQQIHADRAWVKELRSRFFDSKKMYVSDIIACDPESGETMAFKYSEVDPCMAKDKYRSMHERQRGLFWVCKDYLSPAGCASGRQCPHLHVPAEKFARVVAASQEKTRGGQPHEVSPGEAPSNNGSIPMSPMSAMSQSWGEVDVAPSPTNYITPPQTPPTAYSHGPSQQYCGRAYPQGGWDRHQGYGPVSPLSVDSEAYGYDGYNSSNATPNYRHPACNDILYPSLEEQYSMHQQQQQQMHQQQAAQQQQQQAAQQKQARGRAGNRAIKIEHPNAASAACAITAPSGNQDAFEMKLETSEGKSGSSTPNSRSHSCPPISRKNSSYFSLDGAAEDDTETEEEDSRPLVMERSALGISRHRSRSSEVVVRRGILLQ
eukprot:TRINITY_DN6337_c0_g1_i1.p1 TRINITY_DN6337_c0_g1~~TRINITY_DN6337_c0_g1_i1.p1  ORF type:complete len:493 (+),score=214.69 TRINITY_DN6337_c0_g1_i1:58-1536(+)